MYAGVTLGAITLAAAPEPSDAGQPAPVAAEPLSSTPVDLSDEAVMMLAGTALIGLAAAVRRAS